MDVYSFLWENVTYIPVFLVYLGGIVVSFSLRRRCPLSATFAVFALVMLSIGLAGQLLFYAYVRMSPNALENLRLMSLLVRVFSAVIDCGAAALFIAAVFTNRKVNVPTNFLPETKHR